MSLFTKYKTKIDQVIDSRNDETKEEAHKTGNQPIFKIWLWYLRLHNFWTQLNVHSGPISDIMRSLLYMKMMLVTRVMMNKLNNYVICEILLGHFTVELNFCEEINKHIIYTKLSFIIHMIVC